MLSFAFAKLQFYVDCGFNFFVGEKYYRLNVAKHADPENVPDNPDDWIEAFNTFSIYEVLPQLIELWGLNVETQAESKKNIEKLTAR